MLKFPSFTFWVVTLMAVALAATLFFAPRTYRSFVLLQSAAEAGAPATSDLRPWMTVGYVSTAYHAPLPALLGAIGLPNVTPETTTLSAIAKSRLKEPLEFMAEVQKAVAAVAEVPPAPETTAAEAESWSDWIENLLSALLTYRYEAFAAVLLLGAIGLPVPTGFSTVLAGSLIAAGEMEWVWTGGIAVIASLVGDAIGYGIGHIAREGFLARYGRLFGYTQRSRVRIRDLFDRWGGLTVLLTRTLVSHLSSVASLLAGISRYSFPAFFAFALVGRLLWTTAYISLGYFIGNNIDASGDFLGFLSGLLVSLGAVVILVSVLIEHRNRQLAESSGT